VLDGGPPVTRAEPVTHGICAPCSSAFLAGISDELTDRTREEELLASDDDDRDPDGDFTR
jgi:hypothetical protein